MFNFHHKKWLIYCGTIYRRNELGCDFSKSNELILLSANPTKFSNTLSSSATADEFF